jgi:hypothetical protein
MDTLKWIHMTHTIPYQIANPGGGTGIIRAISNSYKSFRFMVCFLLISLGNTAKKAEDAAS